MGSLRKLNLAVALILLCNNLLSYFYYNVGDDAIYINMLIPVLIIVFNTIKKDIIFAVMYISVGVLVSAYGTRDNFSGVVFFLIGCYVVKDKKLYSISAALIFMSLGYKYMSNSYPVSSFANNIMAYSYIGFIFYKLFWPVSEVKEKSAKGEGLTIEQIETIKLLKKGIKNHQEAADILHIERKTFSARVAGLRKRFGVNSDFQLAIELMKHDIISLNTLAKSKTEE